MKKSTSMIRKSQAPGCGRGLGKTGQLEAVITGIMHLQLLRQPAQPFDLPETAEYLRWSQWP